MASRMYFIRTSVLFGAWLFAGQLLHAESEDAQIERLTKELESNQKAYWSSKEKMLKERNQVNEEITSLDEGLKSLYLKKNNLQEESYLVAENVATLNESLETKKLARVAFENRILDLIHNEEKKTRSYFPYLTSQGILRTGNLLKIQESGDLPRVIDELVLYREWLLNESETMELSDRKILNPEKKISVEAKVLRLGFIHSSFAASEDVGYLVRNSGLSGVFYDWTLKLPSRTKKQMEDPIRKVQNDDHPGADDRINVLIDAAGAGARLRALLTETSVNIFASLLKWWSDGGLTMYPLAAVGILAIVISVERFMFFRRNSRGAAELIEEALRLIKDGRRGDAKNSLAGKDMPLARIFLPLTEEETLKRSGAERILMEKMAEEMPVLEKRISTLAVLAAIAPLLGLLGTVAGMIRLFEIINIFGTANPKILAGGISEALVATETGLAVAVPVMLIHHLFMRFKAGIISDMEKLSVKAVNQLYPE